MGSEMCIRDRRRALFLKVPGAKTSRITDSHMVDDILNRIAAYLGKGNPMKKNLYRQFIISRGERFLTLKRIHEVRWAPSHLAV